MLRHAPGLYVLFIGSDGNVTFVGQEFTAITGTVTSTIGQDKVLEIAGEITRADFFSLDDSYSAPVTDLPTYTLMKH